MEVHSGEAARSEVVVGTPDHEEFVNAMGPEQRCLVAKIEEEDPENWDMTACVFVVATSAVEARERVLDHYGVDTPAVLVPSGFVTLRAKLFEPGVATGVQGEADWRELEQCPECHSNELRHDASMGETNCVSCEWGMEWEGTRGSKS